jgi:DNA-binding NtrC family response regulator
MARKQVLLVEDDTDTRETLTVILSADFECIGVPSRDDAIALIEAGIRPSCVLMDYMMPGMSLEEFLSRSSPFALDIVLLTAHRDARDISRHCGISMTLEKPIPPDAVVSVVKHVVSATDQPVEISASASKGRPLNPLAISPPPPSFAPERSPLWAFYVGKWH